MSSGVDWLAVAPNVRRPPVGLTAMIERRVPGFWAIFGNAVGTAQNTLRTWGTPATVTSWWRTPESNAETGGDAHSQHLLGTAFDVVSPDVNAAEQAFRDAGFITLVHAVAGGALHLHVQSWPAGAAQRWGLFR
jgi:hypothetical protein